MEPYIFPNFCPISTIDESGEREWLTAPIPVSVTPLRPLEVDLVATWVFLFSLYFGEFPREKSRTQPKCGSCPGVRRGSTKTLGHRSKSCGVSLFRFSQSLLEVKNLVFSLYLRQLLSDFENFFTVTLISLARNFLQKLRNFCTLKLFFRIFRARSDLKVICSRRGVPSDWLG